MIGDTNRGAPAGATTRPTRSWNSSMRGVAGPLATALPGSGWRPESRYPRQSVMTLARHSWGEVKAARFCSYSACGVPIVRVALFARDGSSMSIRTQVALGCGVMVVVVAAFAGYSTHAQPRRRRQHRRGRASAPCRRCRPPATSPRPSPASRRRASRWSPPTPSPSTTTRIRSTRRPDRPSRPRRPGAAWCAPSPSSRRGSPTCARWRRASAAGPRPDAAGSGRGVRRLPHRHRRSRRRAGARQRRQGARLSLRRPSKAATPGASRRRSPR